MSNVSGTLGIWQSCIAFYADEVQKVKFDFVQLKELKLQKFIFAETRVTMLDMDGVKFEVMNKEDIASISNLLHFCWTQRDVKTAILIEGQSIVSMVGSIRYPAENDKFHRLFKLDASESLVERTQAYIGLNGRLNGSN